MWQIIILSAIAIVVHAQVPPSPQTAEPSLTPRPPPPPEREPMRFPVEQDIFFPISEESEEINWYNIRDFRFNPKHPLPRPTRHHRGPPPRPGDPFPPPPGRTKHNNRNRKGQRRLCETKYSEYVKRIFPNDTAVIDDANDDQFDGRLLAKPGEYPHMAALGFILNPETQKIEYKCGGSLVSEHFVLTAAHCTGLNDVVPQWVRIGDLNLMIEEETVEPQIVAIAEIYNHPDYNTTYYYNDIALLKLEQRVNFTVFVRPIRLWVRSELPTSLAFAMGYGATDFAKAATNRLTNLNLTIVPNDDCNKDLPALTETPQGVIASQMCAQDYLLNRDTCQGDSGGPLQLNLPGRKRRHHIHYHLIGITSYGVFCRSQYPSVYTRVTSYLDWIEDLVWKAPI